MAQQVISDSEESPGESSPPHGHWNTQHTGSRGQYLLVPEDIDGSEGDDTPPADRSPVSPIRDRWDSWSQSFRKRRKCRIAVLGGLFLGVSAATSGLLVTLDDQDEFAITVGLAATVSVLMCLLLVFGFAC
jgi:hypothetical protein